MHNYRLVAKKGEGTFSEVLKAQSVVTGEYFAVKCMKNKFKSLEQVHNLRECQALKRLNRHEHIIQLEEILFDAHTGRLALVFELMDCNIYELIRGRKQYLKPQRIKTLMYQLLKSVAHMHKNGIFHRDIKPENILVLGDVLKVADFGSCRGMYSKPPFTEYISTRWYRAPECLLTNGHYDYKMDMWGVGCVFFEIVSLFPLFPGKNELDQIEKVHNVIGVPNENTLDYFRKKSSHVNNFKFTQKQGSGIASLIPHASKECVHLLEMLLQYHPEKRCTAKQALQHDYFKDLREAEQRTRIRTAIPAMQRNTDAKASSVAKKTTAGKKHASGITIEGKTSSSSTINSSTSSTSSKQAAFSKQTGGFPSIDKKTYSSSVKQSNGSTNKQTTKDASNTSTSSSDNHISSSSSLSRTNSSTHTKDFSSPAKSLVYGGNGSVRSKPKSPKAPKQASSSSSVKTEPHSISPSKNATKSPTSAAMPSVLMSNGRSKPSAATLGQVRKTKKTTGRGNHKSKAFPSISGITYKSKQKASHYTSKPSFMMHKYENKKNYTSKQQIDSTKTYGRTQGNRSKVGNSNYLSSKYDKRYKKLTGPARGGKDLDKLDLHSTKYVSLISKKSTVVGNRGKADHSVISISNSKKKTNSYGGRANLAHEAEIARLKRDADMRQQNVVLQERKRQQQGLLNNSRNRVGGNSNSSSNMSSTSNRKYQWNAQANKNKASANKGNPGRGKRYKGPAHKASNQIIQMTVNGGGFQGGITNSLQIKRHIR
jgi:renal tumor antigen